MGSAAVQDDAAQIETRMFCTCNDDRAEDVGNDVVSGCLFGGLATTWQWWVVAQGRGMHMREGGHRCAQ